MVKLLQQDGALRDALTDAEALNALRHTCSHVLAQAVIRVRPDAKLAIGPSISSGFYYDFETDKAFTPEDLDALTAEMRKIIKEDFKLEITSVSRADALDIMKDQPLKLELINDLPENEPISFYRQGDFTDLCAGPHLTSTGKIKAFALLSCNGSYWRGDEKRQMLQRIYGTAFFSKDELKGHLAALEEAKKRDHNKLGRELKIFTTSELIGQGLPLFMPNGAKILQILQRFVEDEEERRGYVRTVTPYMAKSDLYKVSGHWQHYKDGMFIVGDEYKEGDLLALRPMTCPFQFEIYKSEMHSYRDLPIRYGETSTLFRNEASGEMHGLIRVRQFTISEGHIVCTREQLSTEFKNAVDLMYYMLSTIGLIDDIHFRFSKWDPNNREKYIGSEEHWNMTQNRMKEILDELKLEYVEAEGEAAFYGPKLDIQVKNVHGKEDTLITIQVDFALGERFGMTYVDADNQKKFPMVIHRTSIGCYERTLALLIEKTAGALPLWIAPTQVKILPIAEAHTERAVQLAERIRSEGLRVTVDSRNEKIGYKIREAVAEKIPYLAIVGDKETDTVALRKRGAGDIGSTSDDEFIELLKVTDRERKFEL